MAINTGYDFTLSSIGDNIGETTELWKDGDIITAEKLNAMCNAITKAINPYDFIIKGSGYTWVEMTGIHYNVEYELLEGDMEAVLEKIFSGEPVRSFCYTAFPNSAEEGLSVEMIASRNFHIRQMIYDAESEVLVLRTDEVDNNYNELVLYYYYKTGTLSVDPPEEE